MALYAKMKGPVDYTVVGSTTITDGVASGFSANDYLSAPVTPQDVVSYEEIIKVKMPSSFTQRNVIVGYSSDAQGWGLSVGTGGKYSVSIGKSTQSTSWLTDYTTSISPISSDFYYIRFTWDGTKYLLEQSIDKESWSEIYSYNSSSFFYSTGLNKLYGRGATNQSWYNDKFFRGEIDIKETYIKVNGQLWFGKDFVPVKVRTAPYVKYTSVGSPTVSSNIASNFSLSNYLQSTEPFLPGNNTWEMQIKFKLSYPGNSSDHSLLNETSGDFRFPKLTVVAVSSSSLRFKPRISSNGSGWDIVSGNKDISYDYQKWITYRLEFTGTQYKWSYKMEGDADFTSGATDSNSNSIYQSSSFTGFSIGCDMSSGSQWESSFPGEIDLSETYIKIAGLTWFNGAMQNVKTWTLHNPKPIPRYDVGQPSFLMRFDGTWNYYSDGNFTAQLVNAPELTTGGPFGLGALAPTYYAADSSVRRSVQINADKSLWTTATDNGGFFIEFWTNFDLTDTTKYQTFLGNMIHPDTTYSGWSFRWQPGHTAAEPLVGNGTNSLTYFRNLLDSSAQTKYANSMPTSGSWSHFGLYWKKDLGYSSAAFVYINGIRWTIGNTNWADAWAAQGKVDNILIGNAKYGTGYTLSQMAEVRILTGHNADDYAAAILGSYDSTTGMYTYTIPTASFADGGLPEYTAQ